MALGTSLPDLFASKQAATKEKTADNSIGNVTGSNSVNVFLGLGLPWTIAAIYWTAKVLSSQNRRWGPGTLLTFAPTICVVWEISKFVVWASPLVLLFLVQIRF